MIIVGDFSLSIGEAQVQFALWAILAAPLYLSVDLRTIRPEFKEILLNKEIIDVNQDPLGIQGRILGDPGADTQVWARPLSKGDVAVALGFLLQLLLICQLHSYYFLKKYILVMMELLIELV